MTKKDVRNIKTCGLCGLNPNDTQTKEQKAWELDYINAHSGICSACINE